MLADPLAVLVETDRAARAAREFADVEPEWPARGELPPELPEAPSLPPEMLPAPLRPWLEDVADRACIPLEFVAAPALVGLGALVGRRLGIRPEEYDDWLVVPNLWGGIIGRPGLMKTHAITEALRPLRRLAYEATERHEAAADSWEARAAALKAQVEATKKKMAKAAGKGDDPALYQEELTQKLAELRAAMPTERRYMTQDATVEKLGELLRENPQGLLILRDELAGWLRTMDKPGREGDREFYLEAWNGTGAYTFDRIGRGTVHVMAVCLSVMGAIQPGKLRAYISDSLEQGFRDDGLLQRLQVVVWPDRPGEWRSVKRWPDTAARQRAFEVFIWLDRLDPAAVGAQADDEDCIPYLRFNAGGQAVFDEWRRELETRLRSDELAGTPAFEAHLAKYRSLMPSLALLFHLVDRGAFEGFEGSLPGVGEKSARLAADWCDFLEAHARKVYADELAGATVAAHALATKIQEGAIRDGDSVREIHQHDWEGLTSNERVRAGLKQLEECGWVRVRKLETGGRPSEMVRLHPDFRGDPHV